MYRIGLLFFIFATAASTSIFNFPDLSRRLPERTTSPGCVYKGGKYDHGQQIETPEPCLNCTCIRAVVVCYLRVCPTATAPPPGCFLAREMGQCCPTLVCGGEDVVKENNDSDSLPDLRPTFQPTLQPTDQSTIQSSHQSTLQSTQQSTLQSTQQSTLPSTHQSNVPLAHQSTLQSTYQSTQTNFQVETTTEVNNKETENDSLMFVSSTEQIDADLTFLNNIPGGCLVNGTLYGDGSAMLSSAFCEYCFCIRGKTTCLEPKCHLVIEGCTPHYDTEFSCCPSRYDCLQKSSINETTKYSEFGGRLTTTTTTTEITDDYGECIIDGNVYHQGQIIPDYKFCYSCYCNYSSIVCDKIKCSPPIEDCQPIIPEGHCCPVSYRCGGEGISKSGVRKGVKSNATNVRLATKGYDLKTEKQSEVFKNNVSNKDLKSPPFDHEHNTFFFNLIRRRLDDDAPDFYSSSDVINPSEIALNMHLLGEKDSNQFIAPSLRENDKTLNLEKITQSQTMSPLTTREYENSIDHTDSTLKLTRSENEQSGIRTGAPEIQTIAIKELLENFFTKHETNNTEHIKENEEPKRNNSKQPSSIVEDTDDKSIQPTHNPVSDFTVTTTDDITESFATERQISSLTTEVITEASKSEETTYTTQDVQSTLHEHNILSTTLQNFTSYPTETESTYTSEEPNNFTTAQYKNEHFNSFEDSTLNVNVTETLYYQKSTLPEHIPTVSNREDSTVELEYTLETSSEENPKPHDRINSKLAFLTPNEGEKRDSYEPLTGDSAIHWEIPAEGRDSDSGDDLTNIGAIYLGAPLSVEDNRQLRKDLTIKDKITESGGVIFMDPKYTDIHPDLPQATEKKPPVTHLSEEKFPEFTKSHTPIDRMDTDAIIYDRKKGPRIQDNFNQTVNGQGYQIIPFVAEDAIRGINGNKTLPLKPESNQGFPDMVSDFCFIKGRIYMNGEMIAKPDPCELCRCFYGQELCQLQRCPSPPDCIPERVPGFCCPRFTCGKNSSFNQPPSQAITVNTQPNTPILGLLPVQIVRDTPVEAEKIQDQIKFGVRVHSRPISTQDTKPIKSTLPSISLKSHDHLTTIVSKQHRLPSTVDIPLETPKTSTTRQLELTSSSTEKPKPNKIPTVPVREATKSVSTTTAASFFPDPWGLLKVSGCNIYGKFFNINDQVEILSGPCSHCICTANGVECNDIC